MAALIASERKKKKEENKWQMRAHFPILPSTASRRGFLLRVASLPCSLPARLSAEPLLLRAGSSRRQSPAGKRRGKGPAPPWVGERLTALCGGAVQRGRMRDALPAWTLHPASRQGEDPLPGHRIAKSLPIHQLHRSKALISTPTW